MGQEQESGSNWKQRREALRDIPRLWELLREAAPGLVGATIGLRVVSGLMPLAMLVCAKQIVDLITHRVQGRAGDLENIWFWIGCEFALAALSQVIGRAIDYCDGLIVDKFTPSLGARIMEQAMRLDLATFEDSNFHDRLARARAQASDRIGMLTSSGWLVQRVVMLISTSLGILYYSPWLVFVLVICVIPPFLVESHFAFQGYSLSHRLTPLRRQLDYLLTVGSSRESAKEVKLFALGDHLKSRYRELAEEMLRQNRALARKRLGWGIVFAILAATGYYGSYAYLAIRALNQEISIGTFTFLVGAVAAANGHLQMIFSLFSDIADQALFLRDLVLFLDEEPKIAVQTKGLMPPRPIRSGLVFENVCFQYPGGSKPILDGLSFRLEPGQRAALVGENGEGKTTLVKLMARLYEPSSGRILLDGNDVRDYSLEELRKEIGVIFQDFFKYDWPARDNIAVGLIAKLADDEAIWSASERSNAKEVIDALPDKLDQMLGIRFQHGVDLSGGQWQRLALARAYLRDAQILVLDEPTAALDPKAEHEVFQKFTDLTADKMALFISHRFSTVRMADRILLLSGGRIAEEGNHDSLIAQGGTYAHLFDLQASSYR